MSEDSRIASLEKHIMELNTQLATLTANQAALTHSTAELAKTVDEMVALKDRGLGFIAAIVAAAGVIGYALDHVTK